MSAFGIIAEFARTERFFIGEDDLLYEWLESGYETRSTGNGFVIIAPTGYIFNQGVLYSRNSEKLKTLNADDCRESITVSAGTTEDAKAKVLVNGPMREVSLNEYTQSRIPLERIGNYYL